VIQPTDTVADPTSINLATLTMSAEMQLPATTALATLVSTFQASTGIQTLGLATNGILDWRTWGLTIVQAFNSTNVPSSTRSLLFAPVTDSGLTAFAQAAATIISANPGVAAIGITSTSSYQSVVSSLQANVFKYGTGTTPTTTGTLDYLTFGLLIVVAYLPQALGLSPSSTSPTPPASPAPSPSPTSPSPSPSPSGAIQPTDVVSDTTAIGLVTTALVKLTNLSSTSTLTTLVSAFQASQGSRISSPLRTDGVLDWRTWGLAMESGVLGWAWPSQTSNPPLVPVTDPNLTTLAQTAITAITSNPVSTSAQALGLVSSATFQANLTAVQNSFFRQVSGYTSNGQLDYFLLSVLLDAAYDS
jgi:hypothetical protein